MTGTTIRVFEHERLRVGEPLRTTDDSQRALTQTEFEALVRFDERRPERIFDVGHRSLKFRHFVGFLQVGSLGIEILPKVDRRSAGTQERKLWHDALLRMLRVARRLPIRSSTSALLARERGSLLDVFVALFLDEVERLAREGLARTYRVEEANLRALGGKLLLREQLRENLVHQERLYVERSVYDANNLPNQVLHAAMLALNGVPLPTALDARRRSLLTHFDQLPRPAIRAADLDRIRLGRKTERYRLALDIARLILLGHSPRLRAGEIELLALLFDMNALWEAYVATMLRRVADPSIEVRTQETRLFWCSPHRRRTVRPDIVLRERGAREPFAVIDTKWKVPRGGQPSDGDLKQMFAYNEVLRTGHALLLYPSERTAASEVHGAFAVGGHSCATAYLSATEIDVADRCRRLVSKLRSDR